MTDVERIHYKENLGKSWTDIAANIIMAQAQLEKKSHAMHIALEKCEAIKGTRIYLTEPIN